MSRQFTKEFKEDAVRYYLEHKDLGITLCAKNLGTSRTALFSWIKNAQASNGEVTTRGSGNFESDEAKEKGSSKVCWSFYAEEISKSSEKISASSEEMDATSDRISDASKTLS